MQVRVLPLSLKTKLKLWKKNLKNRFATLVQQECSKCGHIAKENRPNQETFKCVKCFHEGNADFEASLTIKQRGQSL